MTKQIKERPKRLTIPKYFWDGEAWAEAEKYPNFTVFTDRRLAELLNVSPMRIGMWRTSGTIPFEMAGNFAVYRVNAVLQSLLAAGYRQDETLKSGDDEK